MIPPVLYIIKKIIYNTGGFAMLVSKVIQIDFAKNGWDAVDYFQDIREATEYVSLNLYSKYGVQLQPPMVRNSKVIMEIKIPKDIEATFNIGTHLRGIYTFLMKKNKKYSDAVIGNRLLIYTIISGTDKNDSPDKLSERLTILQRITEILKNDDDVSREKIARIVNIINE